MSNAPSNSIVAKSTVWDLIKWSCDQLTQLEEMEPPEDA